MSHNISIKLAPILTAERWDDPKWMRPDRVFYWPGSLKLIPRQPTPIVRDHHMDDMIGTVTELFTMPFTDGEWIVARGVVDNPPSWLQPHRTKASVGYWNVHSTPHINGSTRITTALVQEISLLRDLTPAEPLAEVVAPPTLDNPKLSTGDPSVRATRGRRGHLLPARRHHPPTGWPRPRGALIYPMNSPNVTPTATASNTATTTRITSPSIAVGSLSGLPLSLVRTMTAAWRMHRGLGQHSAGAQTYRRPGIGQVLRRQMRAVGLSSDVVEEVERHRRQIALRLQPWRLEASDRSGARQPPREN